MARVAGAVVAPIPVCVVVAVSSGPGAIGAVSVTGSGVPIDGHVAGCVDVSALTSVPIVWSNGGTWWSATVEGGGALLLLVDGLSSSGIEGILGLVSSAVEGAVGGAALVFTGT